MSKRVEGSVTYSREEEVLVGLALAECVDEATAEVLSPTTPGLIPLLLSRAGFACLASEPHRGALRVRVTRVGGCGSRQVALLHLLASQGVALHMTAWDGIPNAYRVFDAQPGHCALYELRCHLVEPMIDDSELQVLMLPLPAGAHPRTSMSARRHRIACGQVPAWKPRRWAE